MRSPEVRAFDLLIDQATEGLSAELEEELGCLLQRFPELDGEAFELAASAVELAYTEEATPMPELLRMRVARQAADLVAAASAGAH